MEAPDSNATDPAKDPPPDPDDSSEDGEGLGASFSPRARWWIGLGYYLCLFFMLGAIPWIGWEFIQQGQIRAALAVLAEGSRTQSQDEKVAGTDEPSDRATEFLNRFGEEAVQYLIQELQQDFRDEPVMRDVLAARKYATNSLHKVTMLQDWGLKALAKAWRKETDPVKKGLADKLLRFLNGERVGLVVLTSDERKVMDRLLRRWRLDVHYTDLAAKLKEALEIEVVDRRNVEFPPALASQLRRKANEMEKDAPSERKELPGKLRALVDYLVEPSPEMKGRGPKPKEGADEPEPSTPEPPKPFTAAENKWIQQTLEQGALREAVLPTADPENVFGMDLKALPKGLKEAREVLGKVLESPEVVGQPGISLGSDEAAVLRAFADQIERTALGLPGKLRRIAAKDRVGEMVVTWREREIIETNFRQAEAKLKKERDRIATALRAAVVATVESGERPDRESLYFWGTQFNRVTLYYMVDLMGDPHDTVANIAAECLKLAGAAVVELCLQAVLKAHINEAFVVETSEETKDQRRKTLQAANVRRRINAAFVLRDLILARKLADRYVRGQPQKLLEAHVLAVLQHLHGDATIGETLRREVYPKLGQIREMDMEAVPAAKPGTPSPPPVP